MLCQTDASREQNVVRGTFGKREMIARPSQHQWFKQFPALPSKRIICNCLSG
jgi:hypothetical protein